MFENLLITIMPLLMLSCDVRSVGTVVVYRLVGYLFKFQALGSFASFPQILLFALISFDFVGPVRNQKRNRFVGLFDCWQKINWVTHIKMRPCETMKKPS